jgi:uncharacterized membrane protein YdjX (TVP38/TMEM64 family)
MLCDAMTSRLKRQLAWQIAEVIGTDRSTSAFCILLLVRAVLPVPFWVQNAIFSILRVPVTPYFVATVVGVQYDIVKNSLIGLMVYEKANAASSAAFVVTHPVFPITVSVVGSVVIAFLVRYFLAVRLPAKLREDDARCEPSRELICVHAAERCRSES